MYRVIMTLIAVLRIIAKGRCWSADDSWRMYELLDEAERELKAWGDDGK